MAISDLHASHIRRVKVTFYVFGTDLDPEVVTSSIGVVPCSSAKRGGERRNPAGTPLTPHTKGHWAFSSVPSVTSKDINDHFAKVLSVVLPHVDVLSRFAEGGETFFDVLWESTYLYAGTGPQIEPCHVQGVASLRAGLGFDIYEIDEPAEAEYARKREKR
jgi:hypothetical protein